MGLGFYLRGALRGSSRFDRRLHAIESWFRKHAADEIRSWETYIGASGSPAALLSLHPGAERVEVFAEPDGNIVFSANTSSVGPGYHAYLCGLIQSLGTELGIDWHVPGADDDFGDETEYFESGDQRLLESAMLDWLGALLRTIAQEPGTHMLCLPLQCGFRAGSAILTQLGPRNRQWALAGSRNPALATDIWPWPLIGQGAPQKLGKALTLMWCEVKWRKPWRDEEEACLHEVAHLLDDAYKQDRTLKYPWREWLEILEHLELESPFRGAIQKAARSARGRLCGYRRLDITAQPFRGWSMVVPGRFATEYTDDGATWHAWDETRVVWFSAFRVPSRSNALARARKRRAYALFEDDGNVVRHATIEFKTGAEKDEGNYYLLSGEIAARGHVARLSVTFDRPEQQDWAEGVMRSVQFSS